MYLPKQHEETRLEVLHQHIHANPLGTWVVLGDGELMANHVPFLLDSSRGEFGTLVGHIAKANPVWHQSNFDIPAVVCFHGPQSYISPSWYPSKHEHGKAVPTWNYAVVHAYGQPNFIHDSDWLYQHLAQLTNKQEATQALPWKLEHAPKDFTDRLVDVIVGVEIPILRLVGKWKTSQNRSDNDKLGIIAGLLNKGDEESKAMAKLIGEHMVDNKSAVKQEVEGR